MKKTIYLMIIALLALSFSNISFADEAKETQPAAPAAEAQPATPTAEAKPAPAAETQPAAPAAEAQPATPTAEAEPEPKAESQPAAPKAEEEEPVFNADVPKEGSAEDYFAFIQKIQAQSNFNGKPVPITPREKYIRFITILNASNEAADKILAKDSLTKEQTVNALKIKVGLIQQLERYGYGDQREYPDLIKRCNENGLENLAKGMVEKLEVQKFVDDFMTAFYSKNNSEAKKVLNEMIEKIENQGNAISFEYADGLEYLLLTSAKGIYNESELEKLDTKIMELFLKADDARVVRIGKMIKGTRRRENLPGKEMLVGGTFIDGTEYKAEDYAGKTVLIDFWATWCGPCRGEIPNVKKLYAYYHDKGFEIIGISSDDSVKALKMFIEKEEMPWKQMMKDKALVADGQPMGVYYGVSGIPTMILIGPDGKVVTVNARGQNLEKALEDIYGPIPTDKE